MQSYTLYKKFILFFSFVILFISSVAAQYGEKDFVTYTIKEGLSHNYVTCLQQDDWGNMWIGTDIGLNRFDGDNFTNYYHATKPLSLPSGIIRNLKKMGPHQLGVISSSGFKMINTKDLSFRNYYIPDSTAFINIRNAAWDAAVLPGKSVALTTASGFYVFNESGDIIFRHDAYSLNDIGRKRILYGRDIFPVTDNEYLVFVEENQLAWYNAEKKIFDEISKEQKQWAVFFPLAPNDEDGFISHCQVNNNKFISLHFLQNKIVYYNKTSDKMVTSPLLIPTIEFSWESKITMLNDTSFAINGGQSGFYIYHINRQTGKIKTDGKKFLGGHKIQCIYSDKDKRLWVGTSKGVLQQKLVAPLMNPYLYQPLPSDSITGGFSSAYRHGNKLYAGRFSRNQGLVIIDTATMLVSKTLQFYGRDNMWNEIRSIQMYHTDTLWIGTNAGLIWLDTRTDNYGKLSYPVKDQKIVFSELNTLAPPQNDGYAWLLGPLSGIVARYHIASRSFTFFTSTTKPALPFEKVKSIAYDSYGDVWIGGHSLARWNNQKQTFDTLIRVYGGANKYNDDILTLSADANGSLWLHNAENGLLQYIIKEKKFVAYTMKDGLPSVLMETFSPVINNMLWIGSANQLTYFNTLTKKFIVYDHTDGFPDESPKSRRIYYDEGRGKLYMYCKFWLVEFPVVPPTVKKNGSEILVHEIRLNNNNSFYYPEGVLRLKPSENNLSINFSVIDFERNNYRFAYKLNEDKNWTSLNEQRSINLTALSSGRYVIHLKATNKSGEEKLQKISFDIKPPFWKTIWFFAGCGLLITGALYYVYRRRIRKIREWANIDKQLARSEMKALHAQMNPHFISNSLNSIREMILSDENKEASHFIAKFAHLIRVTLEQSTQPFISLRNTIDYLQRYVEMEKIRNNNFTFQITSDEKLDLDETILPPMLIQPFVENAIWHGAQGKEKSININIEFKKYPASGGQDNQLACVIEDNGIGINQSLKNKKGSDDLHHSVGIENISNRIRLLNEKYKLQSSVTIEDRSDLPGYTGTGTVVIIRTPLEIKEQ